MSFGSTKALAALLAAAVFTTAGCTNSTGPGGGGGSPPGPAWPGTAIAISAGSNDTCALTTAGKAYCWGSNENHVLGVSGGYVGEKFIDACQKGNYNNPVDFRWPCLAAAPVPLNGSVTLTSISKIDDDATCGIDGAGAAWCWTIWPFVELPSDTVSVTPGAYPLRCGSETCEKRPRLVHSSQTFKSFAYGRYHGCGLTTAGAALCVGHNSYGDLGIGTTRLGWSDTLLPVTGGHVFLQLAVSEGGEHTCGVVAGGATYCWGQGGSGQLGAGPSVFGADVPTFVGGGIAFRQLTAGAQSSCGLTALSKAYCWGNGNAGEFGNSARNNANIPTFAAGGKAFTTITAGGSHVCGLDSAGDAWCWGSDYFGQLGSGRIAPSCALPDGTFTPCSAIPLLVSGGLKFTAIDAGLNHTCGITTTGEVWCWGDNSVGQLGTGYQSSRLGSAVPAKVGG